MLFPWQQQSIIFKFFSFEPSTFTVVTMGPNIQTGGISASNMLTGIGRYILFELQQYLHTLSLKVVSRSIYERVAIGRKIEVRLSSNLLTLRACPELISHAIWLRFNYVGAITFGSQIALTIWQSVSLEWSNSSPKSDNNFVCK